VVTVEGLARDGVSPVQRAFLEVGAFQCGFCTPGMVVGTTALLSRNSRPSDTEIRAALDGNLCRCCGYTRILEAVRRAATLSAEAQEHDG
jgi:aerobic-type carbon monoxide dehydrogenase small subunit (CoxS/CutS family)